MARRGAMGKKAKYLEEIYSIFVQTSIPLLGELSHQVRYKPGKKRLK